MMNVPEDLRQQLGDHGQEHVLAWWRQLNDSQRQGLLDQLRALDLEELNRLHRHREESFSLPAPEAIAPLPPVPLLDDAFGRTTAGRTMRQRGEEALRRGEVAVLVVAGGQGSRLGFEHPKGMFPIGPVSNKCLFQIHAEKVLALGRRYGRSIPFLVMTSPATHEETEQFFAEQRYFGLAEENVSFFCQGTMPALDLETGKLLMEGPGRLFTSPNGHGGTLTALADSGLLDQLRAHGIKQIFYFQVDNPLIKVSDPVFLGHHLEQAAEVTSKVVRKDDPADKLGNLVLVGGRCTIIEYSDLPGELARQTDAAGHLRLWAGSPAIHLFAVDFLARVTRGRQRISFHVARKKVPYLNDAGAVVKPERENALKFEMFIFDVLPLAERWAVAETSRREEFVPLKNATGPDSPETVRQALSDLAADWLERAGVAVPRRADGGAAAALEINPLFALDAEELATKVDRTTSIDGPTYLS